MFDVISYSKLSNMEVFDVMYHSYISLYISNTFEMFDVTSQFYYR